MLFNISRTAWWILQNNPANLCSHILDEGWTSQDLLRFDVKKA